MAIYTYLFIYIFFLLESELACEHVLEPWCVGQLLALS